MKQDTVEPSIVDTDVLSGLREFNKFTRIITKGRLDDDQTQWSNICDLIETEKTNARREKRQKDDHCTACTTVSGETDAFQKLKNIVRMKGHDPTHKSICLVEQGCVYLSKIVPWLENMLFDKNIDVPHQGLFCCWCRAGFNYAKWEQPGSFLSSRTKLCWELLLRGLIRYRVEDISDQHEDEGKIGWKRQ